MNLIKKIPDLVKKISEKNKHLISSELDKLDYERYARYCLSFITLIEKDNDVAYFIPQEFIDACTKDLIKEIGEFRLEADYKSVSEVDYDTVKLNKVYYFEKYNKYIKFTSDPDSYSYHEYTQLSEVVPKTRKVIIYEETKKE